jgi:hypothetical protein
MNVDPTDLALRHICETRRLLESLITSSESFDYQKAKLTLGALQEKARELGKVQAALQVARTLPQNVTPLDSLRS